MITWLTGLPLPQIVTLSLPILHFSCEIDAFFYSIYSTAKSGLHGCLPCSACHDDCCTWGTETGTIYKHLAWTRLAQLPAPCQECSEDNSRTLKTKSKLLHARDKVNLCQRINPYDIAKVVQNIFLHLNCWWNIMYLWWGSWLQAHRILPSIFCLLLFQSFCHGF